MLRLQFGTKRAPEVKNASALRIEGDVAVCTSRTEHQCHFRSACDMMFPSGRERQVGEDVAIIDHKWPSREQLTRIPNSAGSFQYLRLFMAELDPTTAPRIVREVLCVPVGAPMSVYDKLLSSDRG